MEMTLHTSWILVPLPVIFMWREELKAVQIVFRAIMQGLWGLQIPEVWMGLWPSSRAQRWSGLLFLEPAVTTRFMGLSLTEKAFLILSVKQRVHGLMLMQPILIMGQNNSLQNYSLIFLHTSTPPFLARLRVIPVFLPLRF